MEPAQPDKQRSGLWLVMSVPTPDNDPPCTVCRRGDPAVGAKAPPRHAGNRMGVQCRKLNHIDGLALCLFWLHVAPVNLPSGRDRAAFPR